MKARNKDVKQFNEFIENNYSNYYNTHSSRWVDIDNTFIVKITGDKNPSVKYENWTVWHKKHPWKGTSAKYTFHIPAGYNIDFVGGLLTFTKGKKAFWVKQTRGCDIKLVEGYFYKGYHLEKNKAKNYDEAVKKITAKRNKSARELLKQRAIKHIDLKKVWVGVEDSYKGGNCEAGTTNFVNKVRKIFGNVGGIRADALLEIENSFYTQRAISVAKLRYI